MLVWWSHLESTALKLHRGRGWVGWRETSRPEGRSGEGRGSRWKFVPVTRKCIFFLPLAHTGFDAARQLACCTAILASSAGDLQEKWLCGGWWAVCGHCHLAVTHCDYSLLDDVHFRVCENFIILCRLSIYEIYIYLYASITRLIIDFFKVRCLLGSDEAHIRYAMGSPVLW